MNRREEMEYLGQLELRQTSLRLQYAQYRELGSKMMNKGLISWSKKNHRFYAEFLSDRPQHQRATIQMLLELQQNITDQAMLLLELQHSIDCQKAKQISVTNNLHNNG